MKIIFLLATLTLLASCTKNPEITPTASPVSESKMMKEDGLKNDTMMQSGSIKEASGDPAMMDDKKRDSESMKEEMMKPADEVMIKDELKIMKSTGYMIYDEAKVTTALAKGQKVALFFHAAWCPTCRALDSAITSNLSSIPSDTLIVKVDYDTSDAMKRKYGVTTQHTTVIIDKDMAMLSKKLGARSVSDILN